MKNKNWISKALVLGAVFFIAAYLVKPIGVSTQFSVLSGVIHKVVDPDVIEEDPSREYGYRSTNAYYDRHEGKLAESIVHPWNYNFVFVLAIPLGALLGRIVLKDKDHEESNEELCETTYLPGHKEKSFVKRYLPSFLGGFILLYGARMADGCTSGHMMSGMMQGAVSGYVFAAAVFAVAIPTAIIIGNKARSKGGQE